MQTKEQHRVSCNSHYERNKEYYYERNKQRRVEAADFVRSLKENPCTDCGQSYPYYVMDFHHRDPTMKSAEVNKLITHSVKKILEEVAKCDLLCANCHRMRTYSGVV